MLHLSIQLGLQMANVLRLPNVLANKLSLLSLKSHNTMLNTCAYN